MSIRARLRVLAATSINEKIAKLQRLADSATIPGERTAALNRIAALIEKLRRPSEPMPPRQHAPPDEPENPSNYGVHAFIHADGRKATAYVNKRGTTTLFPLQAGAANSRMQAAEHASLDAAVEYFKQHGFRYQRQVTQNF